MKVRHALTALTGAALLTVLPVSPVAAQQTPQPLPSDQKGCLGAPQGSDHGKPWAQRQLAPDQVWSLTTGSGITVGVIDSGVDGASPQLAGGRVLPGVDVTAPGGTANTDCYGHGTFVAGIIAAATDPGTGFAGIAPSVTILPIRAAKPGTDGAAPVLSADSLADGIRAAVDAGARVLNVSASTTVAEPKLAAAVQYAADHDVVLVASAANGKQQGDPVTYPAAYPGVIAVGAIDEQGQLADFSQTGPFISLVAPGVGVESVGPGGAGQWQGTGTSYSAPFVTGTAALVRAYHPDLSAAQVKHRLEATADHPAKAALPDPGVGWGTVNVVAAVTRLLPEESGAAAKMVKPPPMGAAPAAEAAGNGPALAAGSVLLAVFLAVGLVVFLRFARGGRARNWAPPRTVRVEPEPPAATPKGRVG
ncbi:type VII secretion-associated serine protease mycosin [Amycolatopsis sp. WQ 127309]|uniref:type VII secretion-associated serine protease mycosin n=1 Tax=Amycolatopsis sp. WQ 127309 TaxID=2932773 RepID=UPI001FF14245|nr:type VII secretion-associated serine protease mycosin [Amycolatopsis sp. WQ 127309]UOZ06957.1 type VII secretion-associated serine protease mycosin [Amycolatopsis sp. WQ 127309]